MDSSSITLVVVAIIAGIIIYLAMFQRDTTSRIEAIAEAQRREAEDDDKIVVVQQPYYPTGYWRGWGGWGRGCGYGGCGYGGWRYGGGGYHGSRGGHGGGGKH